MRYNQYTLCKMAMFCIHARSIMALFCVHTSSLYMCKLKLRHTAITLIKAALFLFYTVKLSLFSEGAVIHLLLTLHVIKFKPEVKLRVTDVLTKGLQTRECRLEARLSRRSAARADWNAETSHLCGNNLNNCIFHASDLWRYAAVILEVKQWLNFLCTW